MSISILDLKAIVSNGGGVNVDASKISVLDLKAIAKNASVSGAIIYFRNAAALSSLDLKAIASAAPGKVIFEF